MVWNLGLVLLAVRTGFQLFSVSQYLQNGALHSTDSGDHWEILMVMCPSADSMPGAVVTVALAEQRPVTWVPLSLEHVGSVCVRDDACARGRHWTEEGDQGCTAGLSGWSHQMGSGYSCRTAAC